MQQATLAKWGILCGFSSLRSSHFLSFSRQRSNKWVKTWANELARLGWAKNWGEVGRGWARRGREGPRLTPSLCSLFFALLLSSVSFEWVCFLTSSQFRSHRVSFWKRLLRRLQRGELLFLHWAPFSSAKMLSPQIGQYNARLILANSFFSLILTVLAFQRN